ncbi:hypothetical protein COBT_000696, partial [Conglomerata obtusa]
MYYDRRENMGAEPGNIQEYVGTDEEIREGKESIEEELGDLERFKTGIRWGSIALNGVVMEEVIAGQLNTWCDVIWFIEAEIFKKEKNFEIMKENGKDRKIKLLERELEIMKSIIINNKWYQEPRKEMLNRGFGYT